MTPETHPAIEAAREALADARSFLYGGRPCHPGHDAFEFMFSAELLAAHNAKIDAALRALEEAKGEVLWLKNQTRYSTGGVTFFCDLKKPKDDGLGPMQRILVLPIPEPGKEPR